MMFWQVAFGLIAAFLFLRECLRLLKIGRYDDRYVFITGCDTGFGNLLAKRLDRFGLNVFAGCLTKAGADDLRKACSKKLTIVEIDVTDEKSIIKAKEQVERKLPAKKALWAIVNNAGVTGSVAPIEWLKADDFKRTLAVNLFGVIFVTQAFLPLVRRERGRVVNMASSMGRFTLSSGPYAASKFGVEGFSDQLRREIFYTGVGVHIIEPGYFRTGIVDEDSLARDLESKYRNADTEVQKYYGETYKNEVISKLTRVLSKVMSPKIHKVVDVYEHAILARYPKPRYVVGWDAHILFRLLWNLPEWIGDYLVTTPLPIPEGARLT